MKIRIESAIEEGMIPEETRKQHKGFAEWNFNVKKQDHQSIVQVSFFFFFVFFWGMNTTGKFFCLLIVFFFGSTIVSFILLISQIIIDGRDTSVVDNEESPLPTLVYMSREKRPNWPHNFKAGAMNALVSLVHSACNSMHIILV